MKEIIVLISAIMILITIGVVSIIVICKTYDRLENNVRVSREFYYNLITYLMKNNPELFEETFICDTKAGDSDAKIL